MIPDSISFKDVVPPFTLPRKGNLKVWPETVPQLDFRIVEFNVGPTGKVVVAGFDSATKEEAFRRQLDKAKLDQLMHALEKGDEGAFGASVDLPGRGGPSTGPAAVIPPPTV